MSQNPPRIPPALAKPPKGAGIPDEGRKIIIDGRVATVDFSMPTTNHCSNCKDPGHFSVIYEVDGEWQGWFGPEQAWSYCRKGEG